MEYICANEGLNDILNFPYYIRMYENFQYYIYTCMFISRALRGPN